MHFIMGLSLIENPKEKTFPFSTDSIPILVNVVFLGTWSSNKPPGWSLRTWPTVSELYIHWLDRVQGAYAHLWKKLGIFNAIQLSRSSYQADHLLIVSTLCFWSPLSNTFFHSGPFTPTLLDVNAITSLPPHDAFISYAFTTPGMYKFDTFIDPKANLAYNKFLKLFAGPRHSPVSKDEYTAFLLYWLFHSLFYTWFQKINRDFSPITIALANGQKIDLDPYFLAFLYREIF